MFITLGRLSMAEVWVFNDFGVGRLARSSCANGRATAKMILIKTASMFAWDVKMMEYDTRVKQAAEVINEADVIAAYDTYLNGHKYRYANKELQKVHDNFKLHNPGSPMLLGEVRPDDIIQQGNQKSYQQSRFRK